jgi:hypothetical protein
MGVVVDKILLVRLARDLSMAVALVLLLRFVAQRTMQFLALHKKSLIHELDRSFIDQLYYTKKYIRLFKKRLEEANTNHPLLQKANAIENKITGIEEKYTTNSGALAFLGPIGTTAIVLKEQKLATEALSLLNDFYRLLLTYKYPAQAEQKLSAVPSDSAETYLNLIKHLITEL